MFPNQSDPSVVGITTDPNSRIVKDGDSFIINCTSLDGNTAFITKSDESVINNSDQDMEVLFYNENMHIVQINGNERTNGACFICYEVDVSDVIYKSDNICLIVQDAAIGLSSTISSQIRDLVPSSTMRDFSTNGFSSVTEPSSTMGLSSTSGLSSVLGIFTMGYSSTLVLSSVGLPESNPTDPSSPESSNNTGLIVGLVVGLVASIVILLLLIGILCLYCYREKNQSCVRFTKPVQVAVNCLEGVLCVSSDSTIIKEGAELRGIRDPTRVVNNSHQETADMSDDNVTKAVPIAEENKSEGILVEVHVHVPPQIITEKTNLTTCEKDLKVESEGVDDTYTHRDVRKTIDNDTDTSLVTIDYKLSVERNEPIGFVNGSGVIPRNCTGSSSTHVSHFVKPPGEISREFDSSRKETGKPKLISDIDMDFLDSIDKQFTMETTTDTAHDTQSEIIQPSSCPSDTYIRPLHPTSSEPPPQIPHLVPKIQTPSIKTTSFSCIDDDQTKQEMHEEIPYAHNSQATSNSVSVLQIEEDNYPWKHCDKLASQMMNNLSLMRTDTDSSVDGMKKDGGQKPFLSLQNDTNSDDVG